VFFFVVVYFTWKIVNLSSRDTVQIVYTQPGSPEYFFQQKALFHVLGSGRVEGLPPATVYMSPQLSIDSHVPYVHVVSSRFNQLQGQLKTLVESRMQLLRSFNLPSIRAQTSQSFVYIIYTDPQLHPAVLEELQAMASEYHNLIVVLSNLDWGSWPVLQQLGYICRSMNNTALCNQARSKRLQIVSRVDADDALHVKYFEMVHARTLEVLQHGPDPHAFFHYVGCTSRHEVWQLNWLKSPSAKYGHVEEKIDKSCTSAGLTFVADNTIDFKYSIVAHNQVVGNERCICNSTRSCVEHVEIEFACMSVGSQARATCKHAALRTRTPTSAGMHEVHVLGMYSTDRNGGIAINAAWAAQYGLSLEELANTSAYLNPQRIMAVAREQAAVKCGSGSVLCYSEDHTALIHSRLRKFTDGPSWSDWFYDTFVHRTHHS
jgi:hypothetical protein